MLKYKNLFIIFVYFTKIMEINLHIQITDHSKKNIVYVLRVKRII